MNVITKLLLIDAPVESRKTRVMMSRSFPDASLIGPKASFIYSFHCSAVSCLSVHTGKVPVRW